MLDKNKTHVCAITNSDTSESMLPAEHPLAPLSRRLKRFLKKQILVSERNPQTSIFFLSSAIIVEEKKRQVESGSWIVHPFSVFRWEIVLRIWVQSVFLGFTMRCGWHSCSLLISFISPLVRPSASSSSLMAWRILFWTHFVYSMFVWIFSPDTGFQVMKLKWDREKLPS